MRPISAPASAFTGHVDFASGVSEVQIAIAIAGDSVGEGNDTLSVSLTNPTGNIAITDGAATGTILNDDPIALDDPRDPGDGPYLRLYRPGR